jgi:hypothetical protein
MNDEGLKLIEEYREAKRRLIAWKCKRFPVGQRVALKSGFVAVVNRDDRCEADEVSCMFESGNGWFKSILEITPLEAIEEKSE